MHNNGHGNYPGRMALARTIEADSPAKSSSADPRFDRWLSRRLHEAYDSILKEPLPPDLEKLITLFGSRTDEETGTARQVSLGQRNGRTSLGG